MTTNTTSSAKKLTKRDHFNTLLTIPAVSDDPVLVDFINHELELLSKKNSTDKKPTATQQANNTLKEAIIDLLVDGNPYTVSQIIKEVPECAGLSNQKVSALMVQLVNEGQVEKVIEKRVSYFKLVV
jgi:hypothetical protein